jgi:hypothetical protein
MLNTLKKYLTAELIIVLGLAYVFLFFGLQKIFVTYLWEGWMPLWMEGLLGMSKVFWTKVVGGAEVIMGLGVLYPRSRTIVALIVSLHLIAIVSVTQLSDIGIRDTGLLLMALALLRMGLKD